MLFVGKDLNYHIAWIVERDELYLIVCNITKF